MKQHGISWLNGHNNLNGDPCKGESWNPFVGCTHAGTPGCDNCYAKAVSNRFSPNQDFSQVRFIESRLNIPLKAKKPRAYFVNSMSDLFHEAAEFERILAIHRVMQDSPNHLFIVSTKRAERMYEFFDWVADWGELDGELPLPNVVYLVTTENQEQADKRIPLLLEAKAKGWIKYAGVSMEPLLSGVDFGPWFGADGALCLKCGSFSQEGGCEVSQESEHSPIICDHCGGECIENPELDWVIVGGESGPKARPMHPDWVRSIRDQCKEAGVPFFFKQWGSWAPEAHCQAAKYNDAPTTYVDLSGKLEYPSHTNFNGRDNEFSSIQRIGAKKSGHMLDGQEHLELITWG